MVKAAVSVVFFIVLFWPKNYVCIIVFGVETPLCKLGSVGGIVKEIVTFILIQLKQCGGR